MSAEKKKDFNYELQGVSHISNWWWRVGSSSRVKKTTTCKLCGKTWKSGAWPKQNISFENHVKDHFKEA